jgi:hypothetical protein
MTPASTAEPTLECPADYKRPAPPPTARMQAAAQHHDAQAALHHHLGQAPAHPPDVHALLLGEPGPQLETDEAARQLLGCYSCSQEELLLAAVEQLHLKLQVGAAQLASQHMA